MNNLSQSTLPTKTKFIALVMAGGTGGHIFPGLAVAKKLQLNGWAVSWLGSTGGMEVDLVGKTNIPLSLISISGLRGNGLLGWIKAPFSLLYSIFQALKIIREVKPDVVIGFGGFASGPGGLATFIARTPLIIHEQNAIAGLTNRTLAKWAKNVFQAFPNAFGKSKKYRTIGNPLRKEIIELNEFTDRNKFTDLNNDKKEQNKINLLVIGGSRGARIFNQVLPEILSPLIKDNKIKVHHQSGKGNINSTRASYENNQLESNQSLIVDEFIDDMRDAYLWADLIICRAGALTVSEVAAVGIAAIFVPFPYAVDNHQTKNALWLVEQQAAILIDEAELQSEASRKEIASLVEDQKKINEMALNAKKIAYLNATEIMVETCETLIEKAA